MILLVPSDIEARLKNAVVAGGRREVGGVIMGEHVDLDTFRIVDITVQLEGGTFARFVRWVGNIIEPLREFFRSTNHDYSKFNYMGEWHSHHSFSLVPSAVDDKSMYAILTQPNFGARFVALLLVKLAPSQALDASVTVYQLGTSPCTGRVIVE
jgi:hypothetical protein